VSGNDFDKWVDQAESLRNSMRNWLDLITDGSVAWVPPAGFTKDEFIAAIRDQVKSLTLSLKNFGRA